MTNLDYKAHIIALKELVELMSISAVIAVFFDLMWLFMDIVNYGFTYCRGAIGAGLILSLIIAIYATVTYHFEQFGRIKIDLMHLRAKYKHKYLK